ncbi:AraC family transcriptional regulator [Pendulispora brunnea]|uniref:AraC family transcriptional regulator n=1 Tax=Pendulispora brunnea TaxID=2905690 RepID=A0ABZ2K2C2_9BACT
MLFRSSFLPTLFDWLVKKGATDTVATIQRELELPEPTGEVLKVMTIPLTAFREATDRAAAALGDDYLGLHMAMERQPGSYGLVEYAARNAADIEDAVSRVSQYMTLLSDSARIELRKGPNEASIVHRIPGEPGCMGRHASEFVLATCLSVMQESTAKPVKLLRVEFAHPAPADVTPLEQFFGTTQLHFEAGRNELTFDREVLSYPMVEGDPQLLPWLEKYADSLMVPESGIIQRIPGLHEQIRQCLQARVTPTLAEIAKRLQFSGRTLQRRLQEAHTSFQEELDEVRRDLAEMYLRDPKLTIYEIALLLGYSDRSGFERAFMKWRGATPGGFRRKMAQAATQQVA